MNVSEIRRSVSVFVMMDNGREFMRHSAENWEERMGESWEPAFWFEVEEIERAYLEYRERGRHA